MTGIGRWICPTCCDEVSTPYCPVCGEQPIDAKDLTLRGLFHQALEKFTSIDGRLIRSLRSLISQPGVLTLAYLKGRRKPFVGPVSLFLLINVLFFATESFTGGSVFTTPLASHLHTQPWSDIAAPMVSH